MNLFKGILLTLSLFFLIACSDKPSSSVIKEKVTEIVEVEFSKLATADKVKVNHIEPEEHGFMVNVTFDVVLNASEKQLVESSESSDRKLRRVSQQLVYSLPDGHNYKKGTLVNTVENQNILFSHIKGRWVTYLPD